MRCCDDVFGDFGAECSDLLTYLRSATKHTDIKYSTNITILSLKQLKILRTTLFDEIELAYFLDHPVYNCSENEPKNTNNSSLSK